MKAYRGWFLFSWLLSLLTTGCQGRTVSIRWALSVSVVFISSKCTCELQGPHPTPVLRFWSQCLYLVLLYAQYFYLLAQFTRANIY